VYAQGMTVAALEAITLGECLDRHEPTAEPMTREFYRRAENLVSSARNMATTSDFANTGTEGQNRAVSP
jgi:hypothetical protein